MADAVTQAIVEALKAEQKQAQSNPFTVFADSVNAQLAASPRMAPRDRAIAAGLAGFGGGFGNAYADRDMQMLTGRMLEATQAADPVAAFQSDPQLKKYAPYIQLAQQEQKQAIAADEAKYQREIARDFAKKGLTMGDDGSVSGIPGYGQSVADMDARKAAATEHAQLSAQRELSPEIEAAKAAARMPYQLELAQARANIARSSAGREDQSPTPEETEYLKSLGFEVPEGVSYRALGLGERMSERAAVSDRYEDRKTFDPVMNRQLNNKLSDAERFLTRKQNIDTALSAFDESETIAGAMTRGVTANYIKDSDAADLQRQIKEAAFAALKPTFPGSLSDEERREMLRVSGGDFGVPIGTIKKIFDRKEQAIVGDTNRDIERMKDAGYQVPFKPIESRDGRSSVPKRLDGETPAQFLQRIKGGQ